MEIKDGWESQVGLELVWMTKLLSAKLHKHKHKLEVFLVFFEIQVFSNGDQCVLKSCYIPNAVKSLQYSQQSFNISTDITFSIHYF